MFNHSIGKVGSSLRWVIYHLESNHQTRILLASQENDLPFSDLSSENNKDITLFFNPWQNFLPTSSNKAHSLTLENCWHLSSMIFSSRRKSFAWVARKLPKSSISLFSRRNATQSGIKLHDWASKWNNWSSYESHLLIVETLHFRDSLVISTLLQPLDVHQESSRFKELNIFPYFKWGLNISGWILALIKNPCVCA